jgi:hypothetical protein
MGMDVRTGMGFANLLEEISWGFKDVFTRLSRLFGPSG